MDVASRQDRNTVTRVVRDALLQFCRSRNLFGGQVVLDGIICITGRGEGQELVVKLHEKLGVNSEGLAGSLRREDEAEDLSPFGKRRRLEDSAYEDASPGCSEISAEQDYLQHGEENNSARDLSLPPGTIAITPDEDASSSSSPAPFSTLSPDVQPSGKSLSNSFTGRSFFSSVNPYFMQKRSPMKSERWSPNQPIPTIPECKQCNYTFNSFDILSDHNEGVHSVFTCQHCFKTFTSRSNLERHSRLHTGHKPYACTICGKAFSRKDHLSNHATKHAYKCGTCSKRFPDKKLLVSHYLADHSAVLTNICDFCNKGFSSGEAYEEHMKVHPQLYDDDAVGSILPSPVSAHSSLAPSPATTPINMKKFTCKWCRFSSNDSLTLTKHSLIHSDSQRCYTCLVCAKMFEDPLHYSDHLLLHQNEINVFECVLCRQICSTLHSLRRHEANHMSTSDYIDEPPLKTEPVPKPRPAFDEHQALLNLLKAKEQHLVKIEQNPRKNTDAQENRRDKRKQTFPKPLQVKAAVEEQVDEIEVVQPESPEERSLVIEEKIDENRNKYKTVKACLQEDRPQTEGNVSIKMEPVRSLLTVRSSKNPQKESPDNDLMSNGSLSVSNEAITGTPGGNQENGTGKSATQVDMPPGPFTCSVCSSTFPVFQDLEMHCFSDHNRSPCMFCSKTFAQKANRDRHVCLHTGERPYACPECDEKFSRGDKLKLHRIRVHKVNFPTFGIRQREGSPLRGLDAPQSDEWKENEGWKKRVETMKAWRNEGPSESVYEGGEMALQEQIQ